MSRQIEIVEFDRGYVLRRKDCWNAFEYFDGDHSAPSWHSYSWKSYAKFYWTLNGAKKALKRLTENGKVVFREGDDDLV